MKSVEKTAPERREQQKKCERGGGLGAQYEKGGASFAMRCKHKRGCSNGSGEGENGQPDASGQNPHGDIRCHRQQNGEQEERDEKPKLANRDGAYQQRAETGEFHAGIEALQETGLPRCVFGEEGI